MVLEGDKFHRNVIQKWIIVFIWSRTRRWSLHSRNSKHLHESELHLSEFEPKKPSAALNIVTHARRAIHIFLSCFLWRIHLINTNMHHAFFSPVFRKMLTVPRVLKLYPPATRKYHHKHHIAFMELRKNNGALSFSTSISRRKLAPFLAIQLL